MNIGPICTRPAIQGLDMVRKSGVQRRLRQGEEIRDHAVALAGKEIAGAPKPGLRLIEDQQHTALIALGSEGRQVANGRL